MAHKTICFVSGASRGLGLALVNELATRYPDAVVYAGVRNPLNSPGLQTLVSTLPEGKVHIVKWAAADTQTNAAVAELIRERHGYIDIVIANAGISTSPYALASEISIVEFKEMLEVNTTGGIVLFQSLYSLLKSCKHPAGAKFVFITSEGGSMDSLWTLQSGLVGYGASKAAMNFVCRKIHAENEWLTCFPITPGIVATEMLERYKAGDTFGDLSKSLEPITKTPEDTASMLIEVIDTAKRETHGGEFMNYDGGKMPW